MAAQVVEKALEEIQGNLTLLDVGKILLNTSIVFAVVLLFVTLFDLSIIFALIFSIIYFVFNLVKSFFTNKYLIVEKKFPELKYQLSTVADNVYKTNPIIDSLKEDVVRSVHRVRLSEFIDSRDFTLRVLFLTFVSLLVVITSYSNVNFDFSLNAPLFGIIEFSNVRPVGENLTELNLEYIEGNLTDIFGKGSIAALGTDELELTINPLASDTDLSSIKNVEREDFETPNFPKEIYTTYDVAYTERIAKENQEVVKNYFEEITR